MKWEQGNLIEWGSEIQNYEEKQIVARKVASMAKDGDIIGFGSGSTSFLAVKALACRIKSENLSIKAIPTSHEIAMLCASLDIQTASLFHAKPDWCFDGADEVDSDHNLIKGRGGAMYNEKLVMKCSPKIYILADQSKTVKSLGEKFPIPVEIYPVAINYVKKSLFDLGAAESNLRMAQKKDGPVITENGHFILDCFFHDVNKDLEANIKNITGVIESGLFWGYDIELV